VISSVPDHLADLSKMATRSKPGQSGAEVSASASATSGLTCPYATGLDRLSFRRRSCDICNKTLNVLHLKDLRGVGAACKVCAKTLPISSADTK
jgi:hypothetical protein